MDFSKIEILPERCAVRIKNEVEFNNDNFIQLPIAAFPNHGTDKLVKKTMHEFNRLISDGLYGTPLAVVQYDRDDLAMEVLSVKPLVINDTLLIIARMKIMDTKYGGMIKRGLINHETDVFFGPAFSGTKRDAADIFVIEVDI